MKELHNIISTSAHLIHVIGKFVLEMLHQSGAIVSNQDKR